MFYIDSNGELRHADDTLYHHKYISRKRVGNKWVYTYPNDLKGRSTATKSTVSGNKRLNPQQTWDNRYSGVKRAERTTRNTNWHLKSWDSKTIANGKTIAITHNAGLIERGKKWLKKLFGG